MNSDWLLLDATLSYTFCRSRLFLLCVVVCCVFAEHIMRERRTSVPPARDPIPAKQYLVTSLSFFFRSFPSKTEAIKLTLIKDDYSSMKIAHEQKPCFYISYSTTSTHDAARHDTSEDSRWKQQCRDLRGNRHTVSTQVSIYNRYGVQS